MIDVRNTIAILKSFTSVYLFRRKSCGIIVDKSVPSPTTITVVDNNRTVANIK